MAAAEGVEVLLTLAEARVTAICSGTADPAADVFVGALLLAHDSACQLHTLTVGQWTYPLQGQPVLRVRPGCYVFPALSGAPAEGAGAAGGSSGTAEFAETTANSFVLIAGGDATDHAIEALDSVLGDLTQLRNKGEPQQREDGSTSSDREHSSTSSALAVADVAPAADEPTQAPQPPSRAMSLLAGGVAGLAAFGKAAAPVVAAAAQKAAPVVAAAAERAKPAVIAAAGAVTAGVSSVAARAQSSETVARAGEAVASGLTTFGRVAHSALLTGADMAGKGVKQVGGLAARTLGPAAAPLQLSPATITKLQQARMATRVAATVTGSLVVGAAAVARSLGAATTAAIAETSIGKQWTASAETPGGKAARDVGRAGLTAFGEVWDGLEAAAVIFSTHASSATREFVVARYGPNALPVANEGIGLAGDALQVALNARNLSVGGMVRRTAVEAVAGAVGALPSGAEDRAAARPAAAAAPGPGAMVPAGAGAGAGGSGLTPEAAALLAMAAAAVVAGPHAGAAPL